MLTVSDDVKNLFLNHYRQTARITMTWPGRTGQRMITEADIMQGGLTIDKYSATGGEIDVGTFVAAQLTLKLNNFKGKFNTWDFQNAELFVEIGIKKWDAYHWENAQMHYIPMGVYAVTSPVRSRERVVTIVALDRAVYTDKLLDAALPSTISTLGDLLTHICTTCGITCADGVSSSLPQLSTVIDVSTITERVSYRNMIRWIAFLNSRNAYFDNDGNLAFGFYKILTHYVPHRSPDLVLKTSDIYNVDIDTSTVFRLGGSNYRANDGSAIMIIEWGYDESPQWDEHWWTISAGKFIGGAGVEIKKTLYLDGTYYVPDFYDCQLIENSETPIIWNVPQGGLDELPMYPFRAQIKPMPWLELMDIVRYKNRHGQWDIPITHLSFTLNGSTIIACDIDAQLLNQKGTYMEAPSLVL